jgi:effector-binding domain-containing protein
MKALKIVTIILIVILAIFLIPPLFMASQTKVEKTMVMKAQPEIIWEQVNCLKNWESWDVWHQDTNMTGHYEGPECGVGAKNIWKYNNSEDGGTQTIVEIRENEYLKTVLDFGPMGKAETEFKFEKADGGTRVTWNFVSPAAYPVVRWISTMMIKPEVEKSYEQGLQKLDEITMNMKPKPKFKTGEVTEVDVISQMAIGIKVESDMLNMSQVMGSSFGKLMDYTGKTGAQMAGMPFAIWYQWQDTTKFIFECALPVAGKLKGEGDIRFFNTYAGKAVTVEHWGSYETSGNSWEAVMKYVKDNNLESNGNPYEVYMTDPTTEPNPEKWLTMLYHPVKY